MLIEWRCYITSSCTIKIIPAILVLFKKMFNSIQDYNLQDFLRMRNSAKHFQDCSIFSVNMQTI